MNITALQFGLYRDGDNNLDKVQAPVIDQAFITSAADDHIAFNIEDTTARRDFVADGGARTESYGIRGGEFDGPVQVDAPHDPSSRANLARFVATTLDAAERNGAKQTWSTTAAATAAASRAIRTKRSCRRPTWPVQSPTASRCTPKSIPKMPAAPSTAWLRTNASCRRSDLPTRSRKTA
jgi:hypothetical protein